MRRTLVLVLLVTLLSGCAAQHLRYALGQVPDRTQEMWEDPIRRTHFLTEIGLSGTAMGVSIGCSLLLAPSILGLALCPIVGVAYYFGMYEFVLEPISKRRVQEDKPSLVGPYWERGPQDGEELLCDPLIVRCPQ